MVPQTCQNEIMCVLRMNTHPLILHELRLNRTRQSSPPHLSFKHTRQATTVTFSRRNSPNELRQTTTTWPTSLPRQAVQVVVAAAQHNAPIKHYRRREGLGRQLRARHNAGTGPVQHSYSPACAAQRQACMRRSRHACCDRWTEPWRVPSSALLSLWVPAISARRRRSAVASVLPIVRAARAWQRVHDRVSIPVQIHHEAAQQHLHCGAGCAAGGAASGRQAPN